MYLKHIIKYAIQNTCHRWAWSWLSQAWNGVFINRYHQRGENNSHVNRAGSLWAPLLLHDVNRKVKPGIFLRNTNEPISVSWTGKKVLLVQRKHNKKLKNSHKRNMAAKAMIKTVCKNMLYWADQMVLPRSDRTKPPIGVTMVLVSQVPKWNRGIYADQKAWQWFGFDQAPKWFCGLRPIKRRDWFRLDHVPKWSGGFRLSKGVALVRTRPRPQVISQSYLKSKFQGVNRRPL